jgi:acetyltransferase-like isoleucine patch superfamily enzyme/glycosyltransferase involved in cell wall biosynthesis
VKVVHLSRFDSGSGPASVASSLHREMRRLGHDSTLFVAERRSMAEDPTVRLFRPAQDVMSRLRRRSMERRIALDFARYRSTRPSGLEAFSDDRATMGADVLSQMPSCDVVHVHAMHRFVDLQTFYAVVPPRTPVVRTLHDMSFFTGGCHLDGGCGKYTEACGACPQLGSRDDHDLSRQIWQRKAAALEDVDPRRLHLVAPSEWLAQEAMRSRLAGRFPISVIPHGVDTDVFAPRDRRLAREVLGIPQEASVVVFVSEPITRPVKRLGLLARVLEAVTDVPGLLLISAGSGRPPATLSVPHLPLGHIHDARLLCLVYNAADVFVNTSSQETFLLAALEAMACGIPVIAFPVGGVPELVRPGETGLLPAREDIGAMSTAVRDLLLDASGRAEMAARCRHAVLERYRLGLQVERHVEIYQRMVAGADSSTGATAVRPIEIKQAAKPTGASAPRPIRRSGGRRGGGRFAAHWLRFWMRFAGLSPAGRLATRFVDWAAPPYKARLPLAAMNPHGYVASSASLHHGNLQMGRHVYVGEHVVFFQQEHGGSIVLGERARVYGHVLLETGPGGSIAVGAGTRIHRGCHLIAYEAPIQIGEDVGISQNCAVYSYRHGVAPGTPIAGQPLQSRGPVRIGDHAWLGVGVIVLDGVHIGAGAVVGAGSVVTRDIPDGAIAAGVPARVVGMRDQPGGDRPAVSAGGHGEE